MIFALLGANVIPPIASDASPSLIGCQSTPALRVSQTPPCAAPTSQWFVSVGSTAIEAIRPTTGCKGLTWPSRIGAGPILVHTVEARVLTDASGATVVVVALRLAVAVGAAAISSSARARAPSGIAGRG